MAGLIKKQILKHLSKFAKNLSADSINLSTLRGEGELSNLDLDCVAIQNLINLPTWLQINQAKCNRVHVKIPWTKLKTTSIVIFLDTVELDMVTCEKPRPPNGPSPIEASASSGDSSYGFIQKVLEGITVRINSISVNFTSKVFKAEFQLSQLMVISSDPEGKQADLRFTRILNKEFGQVLTFKKVTWQTMRIVTDSATALSGGVTTPIRLITNQASIRIILRRKVSDLSVLASKLLIQFDDLLWVLTDAQVQSALLCVKSIREIIERSNKQSNKDKREVNLSQTPSTPTPHPIDLPTTPSSDPYFNKHVIHESSFHLELDRIDLHICDDGSTNNMKATYKKVVEGGAILLTFYGLKMDHYPSHRAGKSRSHFRDHGEIAASRDKWAEEIIIRFRKDFVELKKAALQVGHKPKYSSSKLVESCVIFQLMDIEIGQVSSSSDKERTTTKILSSQRKELLLPDDMPLVCANKTSYYFPDRRDYPAPHSNIFVRVNAPRIHVHYTSLLWLNQLALSTVKSVQEMLDDLGVAGSGGNSQDEEHVDIRVETLMPKVFIPSPTESEDPETPLGIELQISQAVITNCRVGENTSRNSLKKLINVIKESYIAKNNSTFPCQPGSDLDILHHSVLDHADGSDIPLNITLESPKPELVDASLKQKASNDIWSIWFRQLWLDFVIKDRSNPAVNQTKTSPFLDSIPIFIWISENEDKLSEKTKISEQSPRRSFSAPDLPRGSPDVDQSKSDDCLDESRSCDSNVARPHRKKLLEFYHQTQEESPEKMKVEIQEVSGPAKSYILINSGKPLKLMLTHHQFLFLIHFAESIQGIGEKAFSDTETILSDRSSVSGSIGSPVHMKNEKEIDSSAVRISLPQIDVFLVLQPIPNGLEPNLNETHPAPIPTPNLNPYNSAYMAATYRSPSATMSECSSLDTVSILGDDPVDIVPFGGSLPASPNLGRHSDTSVNGPLSNLRKIASKTMHNKMKDAAVNGSFETLHCRSTTVTSSGYDTGSDSFVTSQEEDRASIASSGDLDQFVYINSPAHFNESFNNSQSLPQESYAGPVDNLMLASIDTVIDTTENQGISAAEICTVDINEDKVKCGKKMVSVLHVRAEHGVELTVDSYGKNSAVKLVANNISLHELGNLTEESSSNLFLHPADQKKGSSEKLDTPHLRLRIDDGPSAARYSPQAAKVGMMQIMVDGVREQILTSTLSSIGAFLEDDVAPEIVPMKIEANDIQLSIEDDAKPIYPTTVPAPPVVLNVSHCDVTRDDKGAFHVNTQTSANSLPAVIEKMNKLQTAVNQTQAPPTNGVNQTVITTNGTDHSPVTDTTVPNGHAIIVNGFEEGNETKYNSNCDPLKTEIETQSADPDLVELRTELDRVKQERDSLSMALQMVQQDLMLSEQERHKLKSKFESMVDK